MEDYNQLCVMEGCIVGETEVTKFEEWILEKLGTRVKYAEEVKTNPDQNALGKPIVNTGNRNDLLFWVHDNDVTKFAIKRFQLGIRWWEDVVKYNAGSYLYSKEILDKYPARW